MTQTHEEKGQANKSHSAAQAVPQKQRDSTSAFQLVDNRPEAVAQRKLQAMADSSPQVQQAAQLQTQADDAVAQRQPVMQKQPNHTGLPDTLKTGIEHLSGMSLDDVKVHRNSAKPAQLQAHAYAQGTKIHLGPGQEKHLPHEAWHVVQQKQGRVRPTMQMKAGLNINDDAGLEKEADVMGVRSANFGRAEGRSARLGAGPVARATHGTAMVMGGVIQPMWDWLWKIMKRCKRKKGAENTAEKKAKKRGEDKQQQKESEIQKMKETEHKVVYGRTGNPAVMKQRTIYLGRAQGGKQHGSTPKQERRIGVTGDDGGVLESKEMAGLAKASGDRDGRGGRSVMGGGGDEGKPVDEKKPEPSQWRQGDIKRMIDNIRRSNRKNHRNYFNKTDYDKFCGEMVIEPLSVGKELDQILSEIDMELKRRQTPEPDAEEKKEEKYRPEPEATIHAHAPSLTHNGRLVAEDWIKRGATGARGRRGRFSHVHFPDDAGRSLLVDNRTRTVFGEIKGHMDTTTGSGRRAGDLAQGLYQQYLRDRK